jgi:hypothetical protein
MEQRLQIKKLRKGHHKAKEIAAKLVQHSGTEASSSSEVYHWMREFAGGLEQVEDARRSSRPLISSVTRESRPREGTYQIIGCTAGRDLPLFSITCLLCSNVCSSLESPTSEMDSSLSIGEHEQEASVNGKIPGDFGAQSATRKLTKFLDRGRVLYYVG